MEKLGLTVHELVVKIRSMLVRYFDELRNLSYMLNEKIAYTITQTCNIKAKRTQLYI